MGTTTKKKQNKLVNYIMAPFKVLGKARKLYMKTIFDCSQQVGQAGIVMTCTVPNRIPQQLLKSSSNDAPTNNVIDMNMSRELKTQTLESTSRSYSTGVGRLGKIDENKPCDFKELDVNKVVYPRSRSYALV